MIELSNHLLHAESLFLLRLIIGNSLYQLHLTTIEDPWYFWKGICVSKAHKPVSLSENPTFTKV